MSALRGNALARGRTAAGRRALFAICCALIGLGVLAPAAFGGQIVWSTGDGIWAMNDDGMSPRELVSRRSQPLVQSLPAGTLAQPDVFANGGTDVLFLGQTNAFAATGQPLACGADCSGTYELRAGVLTELGPAAAASAGSAYSESQPRITADGQELFGSSLLTGIGSATSSSARALVERPLNAGASVNPWGGTEGEIEPGSGFDGAPDPADPTQAAWVEAQGCGYQTNGLASCQFAVQFGSATSAGNAPIVIYDNEYQSANGRGPTSLDISSDGSTLLMVDPYAPNTGIYTTPIAGVPGAKTVTEVIAQPAGWTFGQARFAGSKIVFDAHQVIAGKTTGDIYTIPAGCNVQMCTFPASATNLTHDAAANSSDPAWTSATAPLLALKVTPSPRVTNVAVHSRVIHVGKQLRLTVTLSAPGTVVVKISGRVGSSHHTRTFGSVRFNGSAGANRLAFARVAGARLAPGSYTAAVALAGSSAPPWVFHFGVRP